MTFRLQVLLLLVLLLLSLGRRSLYYAVRDLLAVGLRQPMMSR
jgi:hypothetical protein